MGAWVPHALAVRLPAAAADGACSMVPRRASTSRTSRRPSLEIGLGRHDVQARASAARWVEPRHQRCA
eukprot:3434112-Prymnesium_polylepis.1